MTPLLALLACRSGPEPYRPRSALDFEGARPRNVLVISWDTTRVDHLGPAETPRLQSFLDGAVVLADHRSCSDWTYASVFCVLAGSGGAEAGFIASTRPEELIAVPAAQDLAPELMAAEGYQTALVSTNPWFNEVSGLSQGSQIERYQLNGSAGWVVDTTLELFGDGHIDPGAPWLVHAHMVDPHIAYAPPEAYRAALDGLEPLLGPGGRSYDLDTAAGHYQLAEDWALLDEETRALALEHIEARYRGELAYADEALGRLLDEAEAAGLLEDALILFFTDHGEQLFERDLLGHGYSLYESENRALAAFAAPGLAPMTWEGPTTHADLWPTVRDALGLAPLASWTGLPLGLRGSESPRFAQRRSADQQLQMVERGGLKLVYRYDGWRALYDLRADPEELEDRYDPEDPEVIALWELLLPEIEASLAVWPEPEPIEPGP